MFIEISLLKLKNFNSRSPGKFPINANRWEEFLRLSITISIYPQNIRAYRATFIWLFAFQALAWFYFLWFFWSIWHQLGVTHELKCWLGLEQDTWNGFTYLSKVWILSELLQQVEVGWVLLFPHGLPEFIFMAAAMRRGQPVRKEAVWTSEFQIVVLAHSFHQSTLQLKSRGNRLISFEKSRSQIQPKTHRDGLQPMSF